MTELKTQLQYLQRENQSLKEENENKKRIIETMLNQNNELLKLYHEIYNKNNVTHYQEKSTRLSDSNNCTTVQLLLLYSTTAIYYNCY